MSFDPSAVELAFTDNIDFSSNSIDIYYEDFQGHPSISLFVNDMHFIKNITNIEKFKKVQQVVDNLILPYYPMVGATRHDYLNDDGNRNIFHGIYSKVE